MPNLLTLDDWQAAYRAGASARALLVARRERLAAHGRPIYLHVVSSTQLDAQLDALHARAARYADLTERHRQLPLWGVPFVVKDNIDVAGLPTTAGCPAFAFTAERDATLVQRLLDAGAICLGKTNLDQFATGLVGTRSPYGAPASAWSAAHVSGGSSSGSAVAVACGDVPFSIGTDTAGSGRVPAGFNHVVGLKPTAGRVGMTGVLPACRTLDCPSVFALQVRDAGAVLAVIEGRDAADDFSRFKPGPARFPAALRIGVPAPPWPDSVRADVVHAHEAAAAALRAQGHAIVPMNFSVLHAVADLLYAGPWLAERHLVLRDLLDRDPQAIDPVVRDVVSPAARMSADDAFAARYRLQALARQATDLMRGCDVLLVPTAPYHPTFAQVAADPLGANGGLGLYTNFVNLLGWCALALPAAVSPAGLPLGITFIAPGGCDAALGRLGADWQALAAQPLGATGRPWEPPTAESLPQPASEPVLPIAVVGAHLSGLPLNRQLTDLGAMLIEAAQTASEYRLYALPGTTPRKPGLLRVAEGGVSIALELWAVPMQHVGTFLAGIPAPLGLGTLTLADGRAVHGFICEPAALAAAQDVSRFGGWRAYLASL